MKKIFFLSVIMSITMAAFSQTKSTVSRSVITFKIKNMGINVSGSIAGLQADLQFNQADLPSSIINAAVDVNTLSTGNDSRDEHLKSKDFFDVARFPKIAIKSVSFKHKSGNSYSGLFNLIIKDKTKQVEIPFTYNETGTSATFTGSFKINRLDFGIGGNSLILSNDVAVNVEVETLVSIK
jgi:polyisoprenoid-binding protein YceI